MNERPDAAEVERLFRTFAETGRRRDRNRLVEAHVGFAHHIARRYQNRGIATEDLHQIALLALVKAVDRFDPDHGAAFTSFAGRTIEGEIKRHFRDAAWSVRVPRSTKELHLAVRAANDELGQEFGRSPSVREVARHLDVSVDEVVEAMGASQAFTPGSLDQPGEDGTSVDRSPRLAVHDADLGGVDDRVMVDRLIDQLPQREQGIVRLRFYDELTQSQIAERLGISQMHVSRLLRRSFELMRDAQG